MTIDFIVKLPEFAYHPMLASTVILVYNYDHQPELYSHIHNKLLINSIPLK